MRLLRLLLLAAVTLVGLAGGADARTPVLPGWSLVGTYDLQVPTGYASLDGNWNFSMFSQAGSLRISYDPKARLQAFGTQGIGTLVFFSGTFGVDETGVQHVVLQDRPKNPFMRFEGVVSEDARTITGAVGVGQGAEPVVFQRTSPPTVPTAFRLRLDTTMDRRGIVRGRPAGKGKEALGSLDTFDGRSFTAGRIRGRVVTTLEDGTTTAIVRVRGKGWSAVLTGPVDEDGFHAAVDLKAGGFVVTAAPVVLPVEPGPEPPPPPPPPPPQNLLARGVAHVDGSHVTLTRQSAPARFFGATATVTVEFEVADVTTPVHATPANSSGAQPRRFYVRLGNKVFGTATAPADVLIEVTRYSSIVGQTIEARCTGTVADVNGKTKAVDVILQGAVAP